MPDPGQEYTGRQLTAEECISSFLPSQLQWFDKRQALFDAKGSPTDYTVSFDVPPKNSKRFSSLNSADEYISLIQPPSTA